MARVNKAPAKFQRTVIRRLVRPSQRARNSLNPEDVMRKQISEAIQIVQKEKAR